MLPVTRGRFKPFSSASLSSPVLALAGVHDLLLPARGGVLVLSAVRSLEPMRRCPLPIVPRGCLDKEHLETVGHAGELQE